MITGAIIGAATVHIVASECIHKLKYDLENKKIESTVRERWFESAVKQMSVEQLLKMMEDANERIQFYKITKEM